MIDRHVVRDLEQPAGKLEFRPVAIDVVEHLHKGVLRQIFGQLPVAHHAEDERKHRPLISADELQERRIAALLGKRDDVRVGKIGELEVREHGGAVKLVRE